jgi:hypothetical protein
LIPKSEMIDMEDMHAASQKSYSENFKLLHYDTYMAYYWDIL